MEMVVDNMDISWLIVFTQQIEESKFKKDKEKCRVDNEGSDGHGRFKNQ